MSDKQKVSVILVDDHKILRDGLKALMELEDNLTVVGETGLGKEAIKIISVQEPDIVVMDIGLPDMSGLEVIRILSEKQIKSRVIVLSMYTKREFVMQAIEAGCAGYVPKSSAHTNILDAIRTVMNGEQFLHPTAATALVESITTEKTVKQKLELLSERELEVLRLTAMGFTSREIGEKLIVSPKTAETYRQRVAGKLDLTHRPDLIKFALQAGLLDNFE